LLESAKRVLTRWVTRKKKGSWSPPNKYGGAAKSLRGGKGEMPNSHKKKQTEKKGGRIQGPEGKIAAPFTQEKIVHG